ncbi:MAG: SRPBCC domain-containing protein [Acidimicrobiia bacterium]|nr:SRPBCC domain-containing protein [Acidimicrobiia bacterium]MDH3396788.1 SRPBCC domain-containing protein [Acidimicrobiia bacterium]MDH5616943.1 SRPBCC domain-containing protein [Acidimicrobiia bacterium]
MRSIETSIHIDARPARVWEVFSDFERYPDWNPFVASLDGRVALGERIAARLTPPGGKGMTFKPKVMAVEPERELRWLGHLFVPGLFDGEHQFLLEPIEGTGTRFVQREQFRGILVPLLLKMVGESTRDGFEAMNTALKLRVEAPEYR